MSDASSRPGVFLSSSLRGPLLVLCGALCFSTTGTTQALAPEGATPYVIGALRMLLGGFALLIWCSLRGILPRLDGIRHGEWPLGMTVMSIAGLLAYQICFFRAVAEIGVAVGTVIAIGVSPVAVAALGFFLLHEKPGMAWYPATALAILGVCLLSLGDELQSGPKGLLLAAGAGIGYGIYFVCGKPLVRRHPPEAVMMVLFLLSGACMSPFLLLYPIDWIFSARGMAVTAHLGIITTALAYSLTLAGIRSTAASTASTLSLAEPLSAALLGIFFLHEAITVRSLAGIALIFACIAVLLFFSGKPAAQGRKSSLLNRDEFQCPSTGRSCLYLL